MKLLRNEYLLLEIYSYLHRMFVWPVESVYQSVKHTIKWLPIIWNDRDWDHDFIYEILLFKLKKQRDYLATHSNISEEQLQKTILEMNTAIAKLSEVRNDDAYIDTAIAEHSAKWGESKFSFVKMPDNPNLSYLYDSREEKYTPEQIQQMKQEYVEARAKATAKHNRDRVDAFKYLGKHIINWWD